MNTKEFFLFLSQSFRDWYRSPRIILSSIFAFLILSSFSFGARQIVPNLKSNITNIIWSVVSSLFLLAIITFFFAGMIGLAYAAVKRRRDATFKFFFKTAQRVWKHNFGNTLIITVAGMLSFILALIIGRFFIPYGPRFSLLIFLIAMFIFLAGGIIFLTFTNFYTVIFNYTMLQSIKSSALLVKKRYLSVLSILIIFYIINSLITRLIPELAGEILKTIFVVPLLALVLTRFVIEQSR